MWTLWQRRTGWLVIGLIAAMLVGTAVLAEEPQGQGFENEPALEPLGTEPALSPEAEPEAFAPDFSAPTPSAPPVPEGQPQYRLHRVGKDENLHILAAYYYGDARAWQKIYKLNKKNIRNPNILHEGQILKIEVEPGWQPRFSLPEFMDKERKRIANQGMPVEKPRLIREKETIEVIPRLLPVEEGASPEEKGEKKAMLTPSMGGVPGVPAPPPSPTPAEGTEGGEGGGQAGGGEAGGGEK